MVEKLAAMQQALSAGSDAAAQSQAGPPLSPELQWIHTGARLAQQREGFSFPEMDDEAAMQVLLNVSSFANGQQQQRPAGAAGAGAGPAFGAQLEALLAGVNALQPRRYSPIRAAYPATRRAIMALLVSRWGPWTRAKGCTAADR